MDYKIGIIGNENTILGFKALGLVPFPIQTREDGEDAIKTIQEAGDFAVLFVTEDWSEQLEDKIARLHKLPLPAVIDIPSQHGPTGRGLLNISRIVEQAVGSDILSANE